MQQNRTASLTFIFIVILVDTMGFGLIIPVISELIQELSGEDVSHASKIGGWLLFTYAVLQFLFSPFLGALSDKIGRRPVLLVALLGLSLDYLVQGWAPSLIWLFVGRAIAGIGGASITAASAYIADISAPEERAKNFGLIGVAFGLGFVIGPALGGMVSGFGLRTPFYVAAGLTFVNFLYGLLVVPESLSKENRRPMDWSAVIPFKTIADFYKYKIVFRLFTILFLTNIASHALQSTWIYYTEYRLSWDSKMLGWSLAFVGIVVAIVQGGLIRIVIPKIGERRAIVVGFVFYIIGLVLFGISDQTWMMFAFTIFYALGGVSQPAAQGIMSNAVPANMQGELQGANTSIVGICSFLGPLLMTSLFSSFTGEDAIADYPGIPFHAGALLCFVALILVFFAFRKLKNEKSPE